MADLDDVRDLVAALPHGDEGTWYGSPALRVRGRVCARVRERDPDLLLIMVGGLERDALVDEQPDRFTLTDHRSERDDAVLMRLSATERDDLAEVAELLDGAWHRVSGG